MHLISIDASPKQASRLRNGHKVRVKRGAGFNLIVSPSTYSLVTKAFGKNKGIEVQLSPDEIQANKMSSPEQHAELAVEMDKGLYTHPTEGGSIFSKIKKAFNSPTAKKIGRELKPFTRIAKAAAKDYAHGKIAEAHQYAADKYGSDPYAAQAINLAASKAHSDVAGLGVGKFIHQVKKVFNTPTAKKIGRELKPFGRLARDMAHSKVNEMVSQAQQQYGSDPYASQAIDLLGAKAHSGISGVGLGTGMGLGTGLGTGMNAHHALKLANMATAKANHELAKMHNMAVHGQITQPPIKRYWDEDFAPPSRGTGLHNHHNLIRGRGSLISQDVMLPPALQSQPYGANFHMQFFLPPEYHRYNDGGDMTGRGLYI